MSKELLFKIKTGMEKGLTLYSIFINLHVSILLVSIKICHCLLQTNLKIYYLLKIGLEKLLSRALKVRSSSRHTLVFLDCYQTIHQYCLHTYSRLKSSFVLSVLLCKAEGWKVFLHQRKWSKLYSSVGSLI